MIRNRLRIVLVCSFFLLSVVGASRPTAASFVACGMLNQLCCQAEQACATNLICNGITCIACGGLNQPCCDGTTCNQGAFCSVGTCEACGGNSEPCCPYEECDEGFICEPICEFESLGGDGGGAGDPCDREQLEGQGGGAQIGPTDQCVPCGSEGQPCCEEFMCSEGTVCIGPTGETSAQGGGAIFNGDGSCAPCGELGEICCGNSTCNTENLLCGGVLCEACGDVGEQCCPNDTCPNAAAACIEGVCEALPAVPLMGPGVIIALLLALTGIGALGLRRR